MIYIIIYHIVLYCIVLYYIRYYILQCMTLCMITSLFAKSYRRHQPTGHFFAFHLMVARESVARARHTRRETDTVINRPGTLIRIADNEFLCSSFCRSSYPRSHECRFSRACAECKRTPMCPSILTQGPDVFPISPMRRLWQHSQINSFRLRPMRSKTRMALNSNRWSLRSVWSIALERSGIRPALVLVCSGSSRARVANNEFLTRNPGLAFESQIMSFCPTILDTHLNRK